MLCLAQAEIRDLIVSTSTHLGSRRLSPIEVASLFKKALDGGATRKECAEIVGFADATMVGRFVRLLDLDPGVQNMIDWGNSDASLAFSAGAEIARLGDADQKLVSRAALQDGLGTQEVKAIVQRVRRSDVDASQAVSEVLRLRPAIERRHVFVGRFGDPSTEEHITSLAEDARVEILKRAVSDSFGAPPIGARLTPTGFVVTVTDSLADVMHEAGDFEAAIEHAIMERSHQ
jgi:ParB-like chromosome segregation protein Spo0J